jgi:hypothetical protein
MPRRSYFMRRGEGFDVFLLAGQALEDLEELGGGGVQGVIEFGFVGDVALAPAEGFFAEAGDFAVDVEILGLEMVELGGKGEHFGA